MARCVTFPVSRFPFLVALFGACATLGRLSFTEPDVTL